MSIFFKLASYSLVGATLICVVIIGYIYIGLHSLLMFVRAGGGAKEETSCDVDWPLDNSVLE